MPLATVETPHTKFGAVLHRGQRRSDRERRSNKKDEYVYTEDEEYDMHESPQKDVEVRSCLCPFIYLRGGCVCDPSVSVQYTPEVSLNAR